MRILMIRFDGLCCHVDPEGELGGVQRRVLLQRLADHFSYVEFYRGDLESQLPSPLPVEDYTREMIDYSRIDFNNVRIGLRNRILSTVFKVLPSFDEFIPKLKKVAPSFSAIKSIYRDDPVADRLVAGYFDITRGYLSSGPVEPNPTVFNPTNDWPKRRLGQWVELELEIDGAAPILTLEDLGTQVTTTLTFKDGTNLLTIGNQTEDDILGRPPDPQSRGHFHAYYDLADTITERPEVEGGGLGLGTGCTNSGYP